MTAPYLLGSEKFRNEMKCEVHMVSPDSKYNETSLFPVGCSIFFLIEVLNVVLFKIEIVL